MSTYTAYVDQKRKEINAYNQDVKRNQAAYSGDVNRYNKEVTARADARFWDEINQNKAAAAYNRTDNINQLRGNVMSTGYGTNNVRGSYGADAFNAGMKPINYAYRQTLREIQNAIRERQDAKWAEANRPKYSAPKKPDQLNAPTKPTFSNLAADGKSLNTADLDYAYETGRINKYQYDAAMADLQKKYADYQAQMKQYEADSYYYRYNS